VELFTDQLTISVVPRNLIAGKGQTTQFTATASGINKIHFTYQWKKKGDSKSLPNKVTGVNGTVLTIPNMVKSDEGQYYCIVTNQWGRSMRSNDVILTFHGMYISINILM